MNNYYFEALNPRAPRTSGHISTANRFKVNNMVERKDGLHDLHVAFKGRDTIVKVNTKRPTNDMMFRDDNGTPVDIKAVVGAFKTKE